jgi:hypothetical protein
VKGPPATGELFKLIWPLFGGRSIVMDENNCGSLRFLGRLLWNDELISLADEFQGSPTPLSISNCVSRINEKAEYDCSIEEELKFLAAHFYEMKFDDLK